MQTTDKTPAAHERGVSFLEIMISMSVLIVGLFGLIKAMSSANTLERSADERKIAYAFCNAQLETIRSRSFSQLLGLPTATPSGYLIAGTLGNFAGSAITSGLGLKRSFDNDADPDQFSLYFSSNPALVNYDPLLAGLNTQAGFARVAEVTFRDPDGTTGVAEGEGYWVTVRVFWRGVLGDSETRMSTFVTAR